MTITRRETAPVRQRQGGPGGRLAPRRQAVSAGGGLQNRRKSPSTCRILRYGLGIQMLLYLFTLEQEGRSYFGYPIIPAGVLYHPAREVILKADRGHPAGGPAGCPAE